MLETEKPLSRLNLDDIARNVFLILLPTIQDNTSLFPSSRLHGQNSVSGLEEKQHRQKRLTLAFYFPFCIILLFSFISFLKLSHNLIKFSNSQTQVFIALSSPISLCKTIFIWSCRVEQWTGKTLAVHAANLASILGTPYSPPPCGARSIPEHRASSYP